MKLPKLSSRGVKAFYPRQFKLDFHMHAFYVWWSDLFGVYLGIYESLGFTMSY